MESRYQKLKSDLQTFIPRDRLIGKRISACRFGDAGPKFEAAMNEARAGAGPVSLDYTLPCDHGLARFEARLARSDHDRFVAVGRNTTLQAKAEWTLHRTEQEYRELLRQVQAAILLFDPSTSTVVECNPGATKLYGVEREELIGRS